MERRKLAGDIHALVPRALEGRGFLAAFTERTGGVSAGPFETLNLGLATGDRRASVEENRGRVLGALGVPPPALARQVHGARVVRVGAGRAGAGWDGRAGPIADADALLVSRAGLPVAVLVADCLPIALADPAAGLLAVVHAGWRGLAAGVIERALARFPAPRRLLAAIGPAVGPCHYEVGEDVALAVAAGSEAGAVTARRGGRVRLDLAATAARVLRAAGVRRLEAAGACTACEEGRFFSHRRDGRTGRQALIAVRL